MSAHQVVQYDNENAYKEALTEGLDFYAQGQGGFTVLDNQPEYIPATLETLLDQYLPAYPSDGTSLTNILTDYVAPESSPSSLEILQKGR